MALDLDENEPDLDRLKLMALMVLWRQGRPWDALLIEELIYFQDSLVH
jgi:Smg protein